MRSGTNSCTISSFNVIFHSSSNTHFEPVANYPLSDRATFELSGSSGQPHPDQEEDAEEECEGIADVPCYWVSDKHNLPWKVRLDRDPSDFNHCSSKLSPRRLISCAPHTSSPSTPSSCPCPASTTSRRGQLSKGGMWRRREVEPGLHHTQG